MDLTRTAGSYTGWTPIRFDWGGEKATVGWCLTEGISFTDPFFDQTVERCFRDPCRLLFQRESGIEEVGRFVAEHPGLAPAAFVFHMSRCGSTLIAQMLVQAAEHLVLSEPRPIDAVLRTSWARPGATDGDRCSWLRWIVSAMGQPRHARQQRLFVKFDAWSVIDLPIIRRAFPDVPWLFVYRDPLEVLVSQSRRLGAHVIPGVLPPSLLGMTAAEVRSCPPVEYQARVLARICEAALDHRDDPRATFVEYRQLPGFVVSDLPALCSVRFQDADAERMLDVARLDAKNPAVAFEGDGGRKQEMASPPLRAAAERWLAPVYEQLQQARARHAAGPHVPNAG
ncbi:MAG TPA: hypothetical protein VMZ73_08235 [Acidimicrobiales bacterium]|nr:hypothetical protein [Acidimicrobiales bacterium]